MNTEVRMKMEAEMKEQEGLFVKASRMKLQFLHKRGVLYVEDLWDLSVEELNEMYGDLSETVSSVTRKSLIAEKLPEESVEKIKMGIIMYIVYTKQIEKVDKQQALINAQKKAQLEQLIQQKKLEKESEMSIEELEALVAKM